MLYKPRLKRTLWLGHFKNLVDRDVKKLLLDSTRPTHFKPLDRLGRDTQTKMGHLLALRQIMTTTTDLPSLNGSIITRNDCHNRSDAIAIGVAATQLDP